MANTVNLELTRLPDVDVTNKGILKGWKLTDAIKEIIFPQMEKNKIYVVTVRSSYVTGKQGKISTRESHYVSKKKVHGNDEEQKEFFELSSYPVYTFGRPNELFEKREEFVKRGEK